MSWYVVKNEWGYWGSDLPPFDKFEDACEAAAAHCHLNVVSASLFRQIEELAPIPSGFLYPEGTEKPETD
jgi:hypothetical protein